ncbi:glycerophosphoinositol permease [Elasticomyces elasticus]|uniref:Glycerophosphoinositol permease n=1 Tax=Exophiala sideris TaxID=1016849 RepID=A0ABR0J1T2_9EURO|nr:glycerophosphoinositol permease [Elasticomyces elasticus]KAK5024699.1 glycerophosphoinositol permease [Exophiala sideris]KAK5030793.1 glycerophosphoinositol permease [Exophiala sideris]KAK5054334.1 glycerophosphoinositol permease [Exophiala sideris]KAK5179735.1 glycerophosphoinositol permease [Eurotiomycetes sp. CCFEE 6388]
MDDKRLQETNLSSSSDYNPNHERNVAVHTAPLTEVPKGRWERTWPTIACGAGLFSDGYLNGVIGSVSTMLALIYGDEYTKSSAKSAIPSIAFAGTVVGHLFFGVLSDHWSRRNSLLISTLRSVGAAESTGELKSGHRNRWFIFATDFQIDLGFVVSAFVPMIVVLATGENHLRAAWRICLALGAIPPLSLLYLRIKLREPEQFRRNKMNRFPILLIVKFYWWRLTVISIIWFLYNFSAYSFGIFASTWLVFILPTDAPLWKNFGMACAINSFWLPGSFLGAFLSDWIGPKWCLIWGVLLQGIVGFAMTGAYSQLDEPSRVAGFIILTGVFMALGEVGPGDNIGLLASKLSSTPIRGQFYGIAAAWGKVGAFIGTYIFPLLIDDAGTDIVKQGQYPFWVSSSLCIFSAIVAFVGLPKVGQDMIEVEDERFKRYLEENGYDTSSFGTKDFREELGVAMN